MRLAPEGDRKVKTVCMPSGWDFHLELLTEETRVRESLLCGEFAEVNLAPVVEASEAVSLARCSRLCKLIRTAFKMVLSPISQLFSVTGFQVIVPR